ncbi:hypothetical protein GXP67_16765 [Rhodocytophaga rosea]|uniref:Uncharacterized protein n=1 Tax=Rhodocytophaga rosea TaxID=2704465 RepID=A0A6C0GJL5_9BACT|nr:hypothetical protein [Rhodocytophaga rosea]QHT68175.1 hypothetical protein GXP67_16765 [Rhodocytophaga rosea]
MDLFINAYKKPFANTKGNPPGTLKPGTSSQMTIDKVNKVIGFSSSQEADKENGYKRTGNILHFKTGVSKNFYERFIIKVIGGKIEINMLCNI